MRKGTKLRLMVFAVFAGSLLTTQVMAAQELERVSGGEPGHSAAARDFEVIPGKKGTEVKLLEIATNSIYARAGTALYVVNSEGQSALLLGYTIESAERRAQAQANGTEIPSKEYAFFSGKIIQKDLAEKLKETLDNTRRRELIEEAGLEAADYIQKIGKISPTAIIAGDSVERGGAEIRTSLVELQNVVLYAEFDEVIKIFNDSILSNAIRIRDQQKADPNKKIKEEFIDVKLFDIMKLNLAAELVEYDRFPLIREGVENRDDWNNLVKHYHHALLRSLEVFLAENSPRMEALEIGQPAADAEAKD
ncbi:MAG: hypothetical protein K0R76_465 [Alphaproteobacteria bacterium]|jgi:8-oxo-dGTP pyrophosphatase MutT (NUDIX family)|nr:hypothetical protein [Alphaproteobacteria bacterium]